MVRESAAEVVNRPTEGPWKTMVEHVLMLQAAGAVPEKWWSLKGDGEEGGGRCMCVWWVDCGGGRGHRRA